MAETFTFDPAALKGIKLSDGAHDGTAQGMCLMEAVAALTGDEHSDTPKCTCHALAYMGQGINDAVVSLGYKNPDNIRTKLLVPVIPELLNTSSDAQRTDHDLDYVPDGDEHNIKVRKFLHERMSEVFAKEIVSCYGADLPEFEYSSDVCEEVGILVRKRGDLAKMVSILREGATYAKSLLGDTHTPVTIYASEDRPYSKFDVFVDDVGEEQHEHIHQ